jgi:hypothetical protein
VKIGLFVLDEANGSRHYPNASLTAYDPAGVAAMYWLISHSALYDSLVSWWPPFEVAVYVTVFGLECFFAFWLSGWAVSWWWGGRLARNR